MKYITMIAAIYCLFSCSSKDKPTTTPEPSPSEALTSEMTRIIPHLNWCESLPAGISPNGRNSAERCDTGDGIFWAGILSSVGTAWYSPWLAADGTPVNFIKGVTDSIRDDGKPYRSHAYLEAAKEDKEFSRDQWLGLCHLAVSYPNEIRPILKKVYDYAKTNGKLCEDPQCLFLPGNDFQGRIALGETPSETEIAVDEAEVILEAGTTPEGSAQHLVSQDIWLRVRLGRNSIAYRHAADILANRSPNNLWFQTLQRITHAKVQWQDYADIVDQLLACSKPWQTPGLHVTFSSDRSSGVCETRPEGAWGTDLMFLGKLLQRTSEFASLKVLEE